MPVSHIPYFPDNIEGQALLDNFTRSRRILKYRDNDKIATRILRGMPLYETELLETVGIPDAENPNLVLRGECRSACAYLKDKGIKIDLVYIDPPFASGADYAKKVYLRRNPKVAQAIAEAEAELAFDELKTFEEKMYGDIWNKEDYLNWIYENLLAIKSVMSETASIYVHLDSHIGHYVKILMDEIFGEHNFRNEVIWHYYNKMQGNVGRFASNHDMIFFYSKNENFFFESIQEKREGITKQIKRVWDKETQKLVNAKDDNGKVLYIETDEKTIDDVWRLSMLQPADKEEPVDYSTQKPEALLERILQASSDAGMVVADFFGGSGVTAAVAARLGRRFVHADVGINSIQTTRDRLRAAGAAFEVREIKDGVTLYRNPQQTMDNLHRFIEGLRNEDPMPQFWEGYFSDSKLGKVPVYLPNLLDHTTKVLDVAWMARIINEAMPALPDEVRKVVIFYVDIEDEAALRKYIADQRETIIEIELRDLKPVLEQAILPDEATYSVKEEANGGFRLEIETFLSDRLRISIEQYNLRRQHNLLQRARRNGEEAGESEGAGGNTTTKFVPLDISENGLELIEMLAVDCTAGAGAWHSDAEIRIDKNSFVVRDGKKTKEFWDGSIRCARRPLRLKIRNIAGDETVLSLDV